MMMMKLISILRNGRRSGCRQMNESGFMLEVESVYLSVVDSSNTLMVYCVREDIPYQRLESVTSHLSLSSIKTTVKKLV